MNQKVSMDTIAQGVAPLHVVVFVLKKTAEGVRYLLMRRCGSYLNGNWQMVTGSIHRGETAVQAARRELQEETGLRGARLYNGDFLEQFYDVNRDKIVFAPVFFALSQEDEEVRLSPKEHDAFDWLDFQQTLSRLEFQGQRDALRHIHENFAGKDVPPLFWLS